MKKRIIHLAVLTLTACLGVAQAATLTVTTTDNSSVNGFSNALATAASGDTINFSIPGSGAHYIVTPVGGYPIVTNLTGFTINGYSQPGSSANTHTILSSNNANITIYLASTNGQCTDLTGINGYGGEAAVLAFFGCTNVNVSGLGFLGFNPDGKSTVVLDPSNGTSPDDMYAIAAAGGNAPTENMHIFGCRFGLASDNTTVYQFQKDVVSYGARSSGVFNLGVAPGSANPRAEFNVFIGGYITFDIGGTALFHVSGNFLDVYPDGLHDFNVDGLNHGGVDHIVEAIYEFASTGTNSVFGTDGDGVNDAEERNVIGGCTAADDGNLMETYGSGGVGMRVSGNYFGVGVDGVTRFSNGGKDMLWLDCHSRNAASMVIGSDFDGVSDDLEANVFYSNNPFDTLYGNPPVAGSGGDWAWLIGPNRAAPNNFTGRISVRGNIMVNNLLVPYMYADNAGDLLDGFKNYMAPFIDTSAATVGEDMLPKLAITNVFPHLHGTFPPGINDYTTVVLDVYELDPEGWANGQAFALAELIDSSSGATNGFPQGRKYAGSFTVPNTGTFDITLPASSTLGNGGAITVAANYSTDPAGTHNGRVHTGNFSMPVYVLPGALGSVGLTHVVPDVALWYNSANYFTNGPVNPAAQVVSLATWEPYIGLLGDSTFLFIANTFVDDGTAQNMRPALAFQPAAGGPARLGTMFYDDSGHAYTNKHHEFSPPQSGDLGRVGGDTRYGANNFMGGVAVAFYNYPSFFNSDGRFDANNPFYSTLALATGRDACVQSYSLNPVTLAQTPLSKALDSAFGRCCTNASYPATGQNQLSRLQHVLGLSDGNFVSVVEDRSQLNNPAANAAVATVFRPNGSIVKEAFKVADGDQWSNVAAFRGGFCVRASGVLYFFDNLGNLQGSVNQSTSGLPFGTNRGDETRIASDIRSYYVYLAGRTPDSTHGPVSVAIWDSRTRVFVTSATVSDTDPTIHDANRVNLAVDALDRFCVAYSLKPTADFLQYQVAARVMAFDGASVTYLTHSFFPFVNYDPSGALGLMTDNPGVAMTTRQICISGNGTINSTNNPAAGPDTSSMTDVYTVFSHPAPVAAPKPTMTITKSGGNVVVDWNAEDGLFTVQTKPSVGSGAWSNETSGNVAPPVTLPIGAGAQLIRLAR